MTLELTPAQEQKLEYFAAQSERTPDDLARQAIDKYLAAKEEYDAFIEEGRAAARRGELHDHDEVMAMLDDIVANG
jgi:predicted transcriptional regulator